MLRSRVPVHLVVGYFVGALALGALAFIQGGAALLLLWPALAAAGLALAYATRSGRWLGKRSDGGVGWLPFLVFLPYFAHARIALWVRRARDPVGAWDEVAPGLFLGRLADASSLPPGIDLVVDCTAEHLEPRGIIENYEYRLLPTLDRWIAADDEFDALVSELAELSAVLYIHCAAGKGRSATVAAALLMARGLAGGVDHAEAILQAARPRVGLHPAQKQQVMRFAASRKAHGDDEG